MNQVDKESLHFILRIWKEPSEKANTPFIWRGVIENVITGQRHYFDDLNDLHRLLADYLDRLSLRPVARTRLQKLVRDLRRRVARGKRNPKSE